MSCHDIGHGLNSVTKVAIDLYEHGRITKDDTIKIIHACRKGVHWCDGNEYEAVTALVDSGYCGLCFEKVAKVSNVYDYELEYPQMYEAYKPYDKIAAHFFLCKNCIRKIIDEHKANKGE